MAEGREKIPGETRGRGQTIPRPEKDPHDKRALRETLPLPPTPSPCDNCGKPHRGTCWPTCEKCGKRHKKEGKCEANDLCGKCRKRHPGGCRYLHTERCKTCQGFHFGTCREAGSRNKTPPPSPSPATGSNSLPCTRKEDQGPQGKAQLELTVTGPGEQAGVGVSLHGMPGMQIQYNTIQSWHA